MHQSPENSIWYYFSVQFGYWLPSGYSSLSHLTIEDYIWPGSFVEGLVEHVVSRESFHATEKPGHFEFDVQHIGSPHDDVPIDPKVMHFGATERKLNGEFCIVRGMFIGQRWGC
jgi:hypothetical protein